MNKKILLAILAYGISAYPQKPIQAPAAQTPAQTATTQATAAVINAPPTSAAKNETPTTDADKKKKKTAWWSKVVGKIKKAAHVGEDNKAEDGAAAQGDRGIAFDHTFKTRGKIEKAKDERVDKIKKAMGE